MITVSLLKTDQPETKPDSATPEFKIKNNT